MSSDKECFVVSPIGAEDSETRERADKLLEHVIEDTVEDFGYDTVRADQLDEPGKISTQVIQHTVNAELVIADLTGENPNVFYELAIRHAANEPFIQIIEKGHEIPFDVYDQRTIKIDIQDLDSVNQSKNQIESHIETIESGDSEADSPVTTAANLQFWENSEDPQQQELADITEAMADMRNEIGKLRSEINDAQNKANKDARNDDIVESDLAKKEKNIDDIRRRALEMRSSVSDLGDLLHNLNFEKKEDKQEVESRLNHLSNSIQDILDACLFISNIE